MAANAVRREAKQSQAATSRTPSWVETKSCQTLPEPRLPRPIAARLIRFEGAVRPKTLEGTIIGAAASAAADFRKLRRLFVLLMRPPRHFDSCVWREYFAYSAFSRVESHRPWWTITR